MGTEETGQVEQAPENNGGGERSLDPNLFPGIEEVPSEYRQHIDPILLEAQKNAQARITEVNSKYEPWKPYEELGVHERLDPETMQNVMGFLDIVQAAEEGDPTAFKEWWETQGNQFEFFPSEENNGNEEFDEGGDYLSSEDLQKVIQEGVERGVEERMAPFLQQQQERQEEAELQEVNQTLDQEIDEIKGEFGDSWSEDVEKDILKLALSYPQESIKQAFGDYKRMIEAAEGKLFVKKQNQPQRPEGQGIPNTTPKKITSFKEAEEFARQSMEQGKEV